MAPVEERLSKLGGMARKVISKNPQDSKQVQSRQDEISSLWEGLKNKATERKTLLDHALQLQTFLGDSRDMVSRPQWIIKIMYDQNSLTS